MMKTNNEKTKKKVIVVTDSQNDEKVKPVLARIMNLVHVLQEIYELENHICGHYFQHEISKKAEDPNVVIVYAGTQCDWLKGFNSIDLYQVHQESPFQGQFEETVMGLLK